MAELIAKATRIPVPGGKVIDEYVGRVNSGETAVSVARMIAPGGWDEPAQTPEFDEYTLVLHGCLRVETETGSHDVTVGQAIVTRAGERIRYTAPTPAGAEYVAICLPAFAPALARRDPDPADRDPDLAQRDPDPGAAAGVVPTNSDNQ